MTIDLVEGALRRVPYAHSRSPWHSTESAAAYIGCEPGTLKTRRDWLKITMSAHFGTHGEGVDEFVAWSLGDPDYADDEALIGDKWRSLHAKPNGVKLDTLFKALSDAGRGALIEKVLRSPAEEDFPDTPEMPLSPADIALAEVNRGHFTVLHGGKCLVGCERRHPTLGRTEVQARDRRGDRVWRVPRLDEARLAFERHVGGKLDWDGE